MAVKPLEDRVLIKPIEAESKTASGIFLPEGAKEKPTRGKVISVGPGKMLDSGKRAPIAVSAGDEVYYGKYAGIVTIQREPPLARKRSRTRCHRRRRHRRSP